MNKLLVAAFLICSLLAAKTGSCQSTLYRVGYRQDEAVSDKNGKPMSWQSSYFPPERFIDSVSRTYPPVPRDSLLKAIQTDTWRELEKNWAAAHTQVSARIDTFTLKWYSFYLYSLREPVLFNFPLKSEAYRFTWFRAFRPPITIKIERHKRKIWLTTKVLKAFPREPGFRYSDDQGRIHVQDSVVSVPFRKNIRKKISHKTFEQFEDFLAKSELLSVSPLGLRNGNTIGSDGSNWIMEIHRSEGYYFVARWEPNQAHPLRKIGEYLIRLSDYNDKKD